MHFCAFPQMEGKLFYAVTSVSVNCFSTTVECYTVQMAVACSTVCIAAQHCGCIAFEVPVLCRVVMIPVLLLVCYVLIRPDLRIRSGLLHVGLQAQLELKDTATKLYRNHGHSW